MEIEVVVEIRQGSRNKYEMDHETGRIRLDRMLFTSTRYPLDYGFVAGALAEDGDPLDALVLLDEPTFPGCLVLGRPVAVFWMSDEHGADPHIPAAPQAGLAEGHGPQEADRGRSHLPVVRLCGGAAVRPAGRCGLRSAAPAAPPCCSPRVRWPGNQS